MKNSYLFLVLIVIALIACEKNDKMGPSTFGGRGYVYGQASWKNNLLPISNPEAFIQGKNIYIAAHPSDGSDFAYYVKTDSLGRFTFTGLEKKKSYRIFFKDTIQGNTYTFSEKVEPSVNPIFPEASVAAEHASGALFKIVDVETSPILGAKVSLFRSRILAESKDPTGSVYQISSDQFGQALKTELSEGQWYALATFTSGSVELFAVAPFSVEKNKMSSVTIVLKE